MKWMFLLVLVLGVGIVTLWQLYAVNNEYMVTQTVCPTETRQCPDGSMVNRTGPECTFAPCVAVDQEASYRERELAESIVVAEPIAGAAVVSPLTIRGEARGYWFFEASFPVALYDQYGAMLAQGVAQATSDWMTEDFVPFQAVLEYAIAPVPGTTSLSMMGELVLMRDNPSGLPEHDMALEIPLQLVAE